MTEEEQLEAGIATLQAQRGVLGAAIVEPVLAPLRARLQALRTQAAAQRQAQARRQVTVMFVGVAGATALAETLDPEVLSQLLDPALRGAVAAVQAHGGAVLQLGTDTLLAAFGTRQAREDDAERAVHCALALRSVGAALAQRAQAALGSAAAATPEGTGLMLVGLHTGAVVLGGGVDEEGSIRGGSVNIAARMQQTAPPGGVRVSRETWRLVEGLFEAQAQPPLRVKGHAEPLATWLVAAPRSAAARTSARGIAGVATPLLARQQELAHLQAALAGAREGGAAHAVTVLADAGLGKSRLLAEFAHALAPRQAVVLRARATSSGALQPYGLLRELLALRLDIADGDAAAVARARLEEGLVALLGEGGRAGAQALGQLIGMDFSASPAVAQALASPRALRDQALATLGDWLRALAGREGAPVLALLDDLQWADDASLDALAHLAVQPALALLLLMAARPALLERRADWGQGWPRHECLTLHELPAAAQTELTRALLQRLPDAPAELLALVAGRAQGNPFFAEELVKMLIDDGVIETGAEGWRLRPGPLVLSHVPATLTGVLQARLDALAPAERRALQAAGIVGPLFWDQALAALDAEAVAALPVLRERGLVHPGGESAFEGTQEFAFAHHLLHQVTYDTVLKDDRRAGHARAAAWLAARVGARSAEYLAVAAEHWARAGEHAQAFDAYDRAAAEAQTRYANRSVIAYAERALALPPPADTARTLVLLRRLASAADLVGDREVQGRALQGQLDLAERTGDERLRATATVAQALLADRVGDRARAGELARRALALAKPCGAAFAAAQAHGELAWLARQRGELDVAQREIAAGIDWAERLRAAEPTETLVGMQLMAVAAAIHGDAFDPLAQRAVLQQALALAQQEPPHPRVQLAARHGLAAAALSLADGAAFAHELAAQFELARTIGATVYLADGHMAAARRAEDESDVERMLAEAQAALAIYEQVGQRDYQGLALGVQAVAQARAGRPAQALAALGRALALFEASGAAVDARAARLLQAAWRWQAGQGPLDEALAAVQAQLPAIEEPGALDASQHPLLARLAAWQVLQAAGNPAAARQLALAAQALARRVARLPDAAERARVLAGRAEHRDVVAACALNGLPLPGP